MSLRGLVTGLILSSALAAQVPNQIVMTQMGPMGGLSGRFGSGPNSPSGVPSGKPPGSVSGKVINSKTGGGIKRAVVSLFGGGFSYQAVTDGSGAFRIDNVEPLEGYTVNANCQGFDASMGPRGFTKPIGVQPSQEVKDVTVQLSPRGSISGKITDRDGDPIENAQVSALSYNYSSGIKMLHVAGNASTDDRGVFRIAELQRGTYYLAVNVIGMNVPMESPQQHVHSQLPHEAYPETFYPNVLEPSQAQPILVKPGDEVTGMDLKLAKVGAFHIRGNVVNQGAERGGRGGVQAQRCYDGNPIQQQRFAMTRAQPDGTFDVMDAVPGTYCLTSGRPGQQNLPYGSLTVDVRDRDIDNAVIQAAPGFELNGAVSIEGTAPTTMPRVNVSLHSFQNNGGTQANAGGDLTFVMKNVFSIPYQIQASAQAQGLYVKSIHLGSQDVTDGSVTPVAGAPLLIALGTDPGEIDGTVQTSNASAAGIWIAVYSTKYPHRTDLTRTIMAPPTGSFTVPNLAPGEYKVLAMESADAGDVQNPDLRTALERNAASVTVTSSGRQTIQVTAISADDVEAARAKIR